MATRGRFEKVAKRPPESNYLEIKYVKRLMSYCSDNQVSDE